jgi:hypothetical protein
MSSLLSNTTASNNTAVGYQAHYLQTTGGANTSLGVQAGYGDATGASNTWVGYQAGPNTVSNASGSDNVAVGRNALFSNTTASRNTAVGYQAGYSNSTGQYSVHIGYRAGYNQTTPAGGNTFIGDSVGFSTTTGEGNTVIGTINSGGNNSAGYALTTGSRNTFVGHTAGATVTTGLKNTIIGGYSGNQGGLDIRTASNYAVISDGDGNPLISTSQGRSVALEGAVPQAGEGITFPATQNASSDANTLDDYEEGNWTPTLNSFGGTGLTTSGTYTKIGRLVYCRMSVFASGSNLTMTAGTSTVTGLPFTPATDGAATWSSSNTGVLFGTTQCISGSVNTPTQTATGSSMFMQIIFNV